MISQITEIAVCIISCGAALMSVATIIVIAVAHLRRSESYKEYTDRRRTK